MAEMQESIIPIGDWNISSYFHFHLFRSDLRRPDIKELVLRKTLTKILDALDTLKNILCAHKYYKHIEGNHKVFEWQMQHFKERMKPNNKYIDTFHLEDPRALDINKLITDFDNMKVLLLQIHDNCPLAMETLKGCMQLLDIREDLSETYVKNVAVLNELREDYVKRHQILGFELHERIEKRNRILEKNTVETMVLDPIYWRYVLNTQYNANEFIEYELKKNDDDIGNKCINYIEKSDRDSMATRNACAHLQSQIEDYKAKISEWSWKYEVDYEKAINDVGLLRENIKVLEKRFADIKERTAWYRAEKVLREEKERARQEALRLEEIKSEHIVVKKKKKPAKKQPLRRK